MQFPLSMMHDNVWFDRQNYIEAEQHVHLSKVPAPAQASNVTSSSLVSEISSMRENIKTCVSSISSNNTDNAQVERLEAENKSLRKLIDDLSKTVSDLTLRVGKLEGATAAPVASTPAPVAAPKETAKEESGSDSDSDMFGSDSEEETEEEKAKKAELLKAYHEKKLKKPGPIAKSNIILDVKPWADDTDLVEMERLVRTIELDGLVWGQGKLVPLAYGVRKLSISCVVEDLKVGSDILQEMIEDFKDHVQSVDVAAFNKI